MCGNGDSRQAAHPARRLPISPYASCAPPPHPLLTRPLLPCRPLPLPPVRRRGGLEHCEEGVGGARSGRGAAHLQGRADRGQDPAGKSSSMFSDMFSDHSRTETEKGSLSSSFPLACMLALRGGAAQAAPASVQSCGCCRHGAAGAVFRLPACRAGLGRHACHPALLSPLLPPCPGTRALTPHRPSNPAPPLSPGVPLTALHPCSPSPRCAEGRQREAGVGPVAGPLCHRGR